MTDIECIKTYDNDPVLDVDVNFDYHINTGELPECFEDSDLDDFIDNLNDWD